MNPTMTTSARSEDYLLLLRNTDLENRLTLPEMQVAMDRLYTWLDRWTERGCVLGGQPLGAGGRVLAGPDGRTVSDGPFAEAKEAVGGYILLRTSGLAEAEQIAREWPLFEHGGIVELRPVLEMCVPRQMVAAHAQAAAANAPEEAAFTA